LLIAAAPAGAARAQAVTDIQQITTAAAPAVPSETAKPTTAAPAQLSATAESRPVEGQLTSPGAEHQVTSQVASTRPTAQAPEPLSTPQQGRTAAVQRVEGKDRCDAAIPKEKRSSECKQVIEARADEYERPDPTQLSPEQKLLLDQQLRAAGDDIANATQRLANSGKTSDSIDAMGVASVVLDQATRQPQAKDQDPQNEAATQAVIDFVTQMQPPQ
jgi:hypothetical protein